MGERKRQDTRNKKQKTRQKQKTRNNRLKPANCHPSLKKNNKKILDYSCFTSEALSILKNSYNQNPKNQHNPIQTNDSKEIWTQLSHKIPECDQETCWLNSIPDKKLQNKMKTELFTPFQPSEWKTNKNAWLSNFDIESVLKQYEETYSPKFLVLGPSPIDFDTKLNNNQCVWNELCQLSLATEYEKGVRNIGVIYNLDKHTGPGTHWVSMFIDLESSSPFLFYFNSTPPINEPKTPIEIDELIHRLQKQWKDYKSSELLVYKNTKVQHQYSNTECGMYSLFFVITCLTRKIDFIPKKKVLKDSDLIDLFAGNNRIDDRYIEKFREIYFNKN